MRLALLLALLLVPLASPLRGSDQQAGVVPLRVGGSIAPPRKIKDVRPAIPAGWQEQAAARKGSSRSI